MFCKFTSTWNIAEVEDFKEKWAAQQADVLAFFEVRL
jgi:hypothetical protein